MKKIIFILLIIFTAGFIFSETIITEVSEPDKLYGNSFYPLFVGAQWSWSVEGAANYSSIFNIPDIDEVNEVTWQIVSANIINNDNLNIKNQLAFKMKAFTQDNKLINEWYVFNYDGYICYLNQDGDEDTLERMLPENPAIEEEWQNSSGEYSVVTVEENMVKIEYISNDAAWYGYIMYIKDVGPYEKFDYLTDESGSKYVKMTILNNVAYGDKFKSTETAEKDKDDSKDLTVIDIDSKEEVEETVKDDTIVTDEDSVYAEEDTTYTDEDTGYEEDTAFTDEDTGYTEEDTDYTEKETNVTAKSDYIPENAFIADFTNGYKYIQIGAYSKKINAKEKYDKAVSYGYSVKVFVENGLYKVLIMYNGNAAEVISDIKDKIEKEAWIKY